MYHQGMSKVTTVTLTDDIDGSPATQVVAFAFEGKRYEIDLSDANATKFREALAPWVAAARPAGKPGNSDHHKPKRRHQDEVKELRQWVIENGGDISTHGRIPKIYEDAWDNGRDTSVF